MKIKIKKAATGSGYNISCKHIKGLIYSGKYHIEINKKRARDYRLCVTTELGIMVYNKNTKNVETIRL